MQESLLDKFLFLLVSGLIFFLPILFIPSVLVQMIVIKYVFFVGIIFLIVAIWILLRLRDGVVSVPTNKIYLAGLAVLFITLISSLFSGSIWSSLVGQLPETDTFLFLSYVFILMFLVPSIFNTQKRIITFYKVLFASVGLLALFHTTRLLFGTWWLGFGYFSNMTDNLLGSWNDLGIFFGLATVLSLVSLELMSLGRRLKISLYVALVVLMFLLAVINFTFIWYILAAISLVFFVYLIVLSRINNTKTVSLVSLPLASFAVFLISIVFIIGGSFLGDAISKHFNISQVDVHPTWQSTLGIAQNVISHKPVVRSVLGAGPNQFVNEWLLYKPTGVNSSVFWSTDFTSGVGLIPSTLVTTGILGALSWLVFLGFLIYIGFRAVLSQTVDKSQRFLVISTFLAALYMWFFSVVYVPGLVIIVLTFFLTGLFVAALQSAGALKTFNFEYFKNPKIGFVSVLSLVIILIVGLNLVYTVVVKVVAVSYFNQGVAAASGNSLDTAELDLKKAIGLDNSDIYVRSLAQVYLLRLNVLASTPANSASSSVIQSQFTAISQSAINAAQVAVNLDNKDYQNYIVLGDVWAALVPFKINSAYDNASSSYNKALEYNPQSPYIYTELAKLDAAANDAEKAKGDLVKAINLKGDYTYAYVQLGVLLYADKDYQNAVSVLERAVSLDNQYSNSKYFLGLSYYQVGKTAEAISQFTDLEQLNPGNQEVENVLSMMRSSKSLNGSAKTAAKVDLTATSTKSKIVK